MTGARAQFGRRPVVPPVTPHSSPSVDVPQIAGRGAARTRVLFGDRESRRSVAFPALALAVVTLTWVDAGVLRAEDAAGEPSTPSAANDRDVVALPQWPGETAQAAENAGVSGGVAAPDANERDEPDERDEEDEA